MLIQRKCRGFAFIKMTRRRAKRFQLRLAVILAVSFLGATIVHACAGQWHDPSQAVVYHNGTSNHPIPQAKDDICKLMREDIVSLQASSTGFDRVTKIAHTLLHADPQLFVSWAVVFSSITAARSFLFPLKPPLFILNIVLRI
jgi:hypothetical protein